MQYSGNLQPASDVVGDPRRHLTLRSLGHQHCKCSEEMWWGFQVMVEEFKDTKAVPAGRRHKKFQGKHLE
jgi:hypothetical protein